MIIIARTIARVLIIVAVFVLSLFIFPTAIPAVVIAWFAWVAFKIARCQPCWFAVLSCIIVVLVKRPGWTSALGLVLLMVLLVLYLDLYQRPRLRSSSRLRWAVVSLLILVPLVYSLDRTQAARAGKISATPDDRPVACLGDSLTAYGMPDQLAELLAVEVLDFGVSGMDSTEALELLPNILTQQPQAIVIEIGGHDYNKDYYPMRTIRQKRERLSKNLEEMVRACQQKDIMVILVEIPRGLVSDPFDGVEREIARKFNLELLSDSTIRQFVYFSPVLPPGKWLDKKHHLSKDGLHPNQNGNRLFARNLADSLIRVLGEGIADRQ